MSLFYVDQPVLVLGVVTMCLMAVGIAIFVLIYQRKFTQQQLTYQRRMLGIAIEAQERERVRVARELHDGVGSMLSAIKLLVHRLSEERVRTDLYQSIEEALAQTIHEVRTLSRGLSSSQVQRVGLSSALRNYCHLVDDAEDIEISFVDKNTIKSINFRTELSLYRIAQELIHNTIRHAHALHVQVSLFTTPDSLCLEVTDDGQGFDLATAELQGNGLLNIRSRLHLLQGSLYQRTPSQSGSCLIVSIPIHLFTKTTT